MSLGLKPLSGKAIKEEETVQPHYLRGLDAAVLMLASVKLARLRAALVNVSNAAVAAASCDFIAATATSLPPGAASVSYTHLTLPTILRV